MPWAALTEDAIDPGAVLRRVGSDRDGAVLLFLGVVRNHADGRPVRGMRYVAYRDMAEDVLGAIAREASEKLDGGEVAVVHRVGELAVGDVSVAVAVAHPHRAQAYDASRYVIEEIKRRLPVWKLEHHEDGASIWVEGSVPPADHPAGGAA